MWVAGWLQQKTGWNMPCWLGENWGSVHLLVLEVSCQWESNDYQLVLVLKHCTCIDLYHLVSLMTFWCIDQSCLSPSAQPQWLRRRKLLGCCSNWRHQQFLPETSVPQDQVGCLSGCRMWPGSSWWNSFPVHRFSAHIYSIRWAIYIYIYIWYMAHIWSYITDIILISMCEELKCWLATCQAVILLWTTRIFMDQQETNSDYIYMFCDGLWVDIMLCLGSSKAGNHDAWRSGRCDYDTASFDSWKVLKRILRVVSCSLHWEQRLSTIRRAYVNWWHEFERERTLSFPLLICSGSDDSVSVELSAVESGLAPRVR